MCVDETTYESLEELEGNAPFLIEPILMDLEGEGGGYAKPIFPGSLADILTVRRSAVSGSSRSGNISGSGSDGGRQKQRQQQRWQQQQWQRRFGAKNFNARLRVQKDAQLPAMSLQYGGYSCTISYNKKNNSNS